MSSVAPASFSTDLDDLTEQASALAESGRIRLVPHMLSLPEQHTMPQRSVEAGEVSGEGFLDLASHVGSRFLYAEFDFVDADAMLDAPTRGALTELTGHEASHWSVLRRRIRENDGRCAKAQMAFTDGMALFTWASEADWLGDMAEEWGILWRATTPNRNT
jgi:hypothetical protein